jgi:hypothetical protein
MMSMPIRSIQRLGSVQRLLIAAAAALLLLPAVLLLLPATASASAPKAQVFALVVANNQSRDKSVDRLRYADDDAARFYELISTVATRSELLMVMDKQTQRTFGKLATTARTPTRQNLLAAMDRLRTAMQAARKSGTRVSFYFYFAGHGHVGADREGYVDLLDSRFSRSDLFRQIIRRSGADRNHIIIDACNAYFMVKRRGGADQRRAVEAFLARESLDRYPNVGVILSTKTAADTHEWSRYRSGIFSHQLISGLWGSADVNGDQRVSYRELAAYIAAANLRVRNSQARLSIYTRPPAANRNATLLDLRQAGHRQVVQAALGKRARVIAKLAVPKRMTGHFYLEDDRGVRYLDFNKSAEQSLTIALLPRPFYYLRGARREARIELGGGQRTVDAGQLSFAALPMGRRGAIEQSFRRDLYAYPFGKSFAAGYAAREPDAAPERLPESPGRPWHRTASAWKWITAGTAAAALGRGRHVSSTRDSK